MRRQSKPRFEYPHLPLTSGHLIPGPCSNILQNFAEISS